MPLVLRHIAGLNGQMFGAMRSIPNSRGPYNIAQISGVSVILGNENNLAPQFTLRGHDDVITAFAMSHGGSMLATGQKGSNSDVIVWDVAACAPKYKFQEHDVEVATVSFSADDRLLLSASCFTDAKLYVWDMATGKIVAKHGLEPGKRITCSAWSPALANGRAYTCATAAGEELALWTVDPFTGMVSGQKVVLGTVRREYTSLAFSADGAWLYGGTTSADVVTVNVQRASVQMTHPVCSGGVGALLLSPDGGGACLVGGRDGSLSTFNAAGGAWRELRPFAKVPGCVTSLSLSADGGAFLVGTAQGGVYRLDRTSLQLHTISQAQQGQLTAVAFAPGQPEAVATSSTDGSIYVWSTADYTLQCRVQEPTQAGGALCCVLTRDAVISGWGDGNIRCHARAAGGATCAQMWMIPGAHALAHSVGVTALRLSNGGAFLLSGGMGGELRVWDLRSREMAAHMKMHNSRIVGAAVMADDKHVAAASEDRTWSLWDVGSERVRTTWRGQSMFRGMAVSADKVSVVTVTLDRKIQMWDVRGPDPRWTKVEAHGKEVGCVASDHRGAAFATGGADQAVRVWDWRNGGEVGGAACHSAPVAAMAFSPDDAGLVSVALDGSTCFWQLT
ncbi:hypothetical protein CHLRE_17g728650v5 [Chlamydomonas reinhardtii]|uniref:Uncharacterized protein n=1 Tax=Chlamydomonas reinhardtii TaxID=3055 RepID=A0A2K3CQT7_CHLRE|nr:uncharacterized protein CHLRE_17g728650v5 [Chlamydomonas reinhardtii]7N61_0Q Chain 0Q, FAP196 [Chlamydomonas reinhardtii]7N61_0S Chain 0S, FAP196 [Chlamydomonas reinhardtii]7SOM_a Chain a, Cilia- and flagella-associated protein 20 [Chlamydomonas reinhardtii]7SOM_b Chain b, Cilia- and flagella-associated protein 20 [Chlamydomonas reinhardtii]7SOM_c Chain c, Cilia- and flagella-associated protein 20 [Chlamydomonas reinhardtii]7SOM_d Chain d, Cilia- and flagella-associated protein 20 [Chlamyd